MQFLVIHIIIMREILNNAKTLALVFGGGEDHKILFKMIIQEDNSTQWTSLIDSVTHAEQLTHFTGLGVFTLSTGLYSKKLAGLSSKPPLNVGMIG